MDKTKIYGIEFDENEPLGGEKRICDSVGLSNNYVIGESFVKAGANDFDSAYPFGAMRLCNVRIEAGERKVTYEEEPGFSRHGKNGNVMVEIPKFYAKREKCGSVERWMISGTRHEGFALEPAFQRDGKELDHIYVGVYNSASVGDGVYSATDTQPDFCKPWTYYYENYRAAGFDVYDLAIHLLLQRLIAIEFCNRRVKYELGGYLFIQYYYRANPNTTILGKGKNYFVKKRQQRNSLTWPGMQVMINCQKPHTPTPILRNSTRVEAEPGKPDQMRYYYDGEDLSDSLVVGESHAGGFMQRNGHSDTLPYHTGRCNNLPPLEHDESLEGFVNAFRYRGIENVWGNIWEICAGLITKDLTYYYTFDPDLYAGEDLSLWKRFSHPAPLQHHLGEWKLEKPAIWAKTMGLDEACPLLPLPIASTVGEPQNFYDAGFYTHLDQGYLDEPVPLGKPWFTAVGGGYDHYWFGSLFTYRCTIGRESQSWLYANRVCLR